MTFSNWFFVTIPFFQFSMYQICLMFVFWSFIGWMVEVVDMTFETGEYQNRGFLSMPVCPIYGVGVILAVSLCRPIADTWVLLFFVTSIMCTLLELAIGLMLEHIFDNRWWDYSMFKFNFKGLICLWVSVGWGVGCVIVIKFIQPFLETVIDKIPVVGGMIFIMIMSVALLFDLVSSIRAAINLNIQLKKIDELSAIFLKGAQGIGKRLAGGTQKVMGAAETAKEKADGVRDKAAEVRDKAADDLKARYEALINTRNRAVLRLLRAFPTMRSRRYMRALRLLQRRFKVKYIPHPEDTEEKQEV